ncbi:MAG: MopE-related protein [Myxococcales bacterium]|nr:MopE-related protein [Myxococcales bacterium]
MSHRELEAQALCEGPHWRSFDVERILFFDLHEGGTVSFFGSVPIFFSQLVEALERFARAGIIDAQSGELAHCACFDLQRQPFPTLNGVVRTTVCGTYFARVCSYTIAWGITHNHRLRPRFGLPWVRDMLKRSSMPARSLGRAVRHLCLGEMRKMGIRLMLGLVLAIGCGSSKGGARGDARDDRETTQDDRGDRSTGSAGRRDAGGNDAGELLDGRAADGHLDRDDDGSAWPLDCDDDDPGVHPEAMEACNFVDEDCDGVADEGVDASCPLTCHEPSGGCETPVDLVASGSHTCALTDAGTVYCWGGNLAGEVGTGEASLIPRPVPVSGVRGATEIIGAGDVVCARIEEGALCWGDRVHIPVFQPLPDDADLIATDGNRLCWSLAEGGLECRLVHGGETAVLEMAPSAEGAIERLVGGPYWMCALHTNGAVVCHGGRYVQGRVRLARRADVVDVSGTGEPCTVGGGELICYTDAADNFGYTVDGNGSAVQVGVGGRQRCARNAEGRVACWLGDLEAPIEGAIDLAVGMDHAWILRQDGTVRCWGRRIEGALGDGRIEPTVATQPVDVIASPKVEFGPAQAVGLPGARYGACDGLDNFAVLKRSGTHGRIHDCLVACDNTLDEGACREACVTRSGLTRECYDCYATFRDCNGSACYPEFSECAGFPVDLLLERHTFHRQGRCAQEASCYVGLPLGSPCTESRECRSNHCGASDPSSDADKGSVCGLASAVCRDHSLGCSCEGILRYCGGCEDDLQIRGGNGECLTTCADHGQCPSTSECVPFFGETKPRYCRF